MYKITELFSSIQGEGIDSGLPAQFIRLSGCNMKCSFCDTDHKPIYTTDAEGLLGKLHRTPNLVIITGGEPLIYDLEPLVEGLKSSGYRVGIETNGTLPLSEKLYSLIDSISLSPKTSKPKIAYCHSLKILYPYLKGINPVTYSRF